MQRHRDDELWRVAGKLMRRDLRERISQRGSERAAPAELQGMHGLARDVLVPDCRPRIVKRRRVPLTRSATARNDMCRRGRCRGVTRQRRPERYPAHDALWRHDALEPLPALPAEWTPPPLVETSPTYGAEGREDEVQQRRHPGPPLRLR